MNKPGERRRARLDREPRRREARSLSTRLRQLRQAERTQPLYLGLARVSTKLQAEEGHSLTAQDARLREEAERRGWDLECVPVPAVSGKAMSPDLANVLDRLARGEAQGLIVTKLDRLTRSVQVAAGIIAAAQQQGWNLVMLDLGGVAVDLSTPGGKAMAHMVATFAQFEREMIVERVKAGMEAARHNGTKSGKPIGRPVEASPDIATLIVEEYNSGVTFQAIADALTKTGEPTPRGHKVWQASTVRRIYNRQTATGTGTTAAAQ